MESKLTAKQRAFCQEYLVDLNATKAAIRAGYSKGRAGRTGFEILATEPAQEEIARLMQAREKRTAITTDQVLRDLHAIATADIGEAFAPDGTLRPLHEMPAPLRMALSGVESLEEFEGRGKSRKRIGLTRKIRMWDKVRALELLGKHLGMFRDQVEHSGPGGGPMMVAATTLSPEQVAQVERIRERREKVAREQGS